MHVIQTVTITDDTIVSSNLIENEFPVYDANEAVLAGAKRISNHKIYEAVSGNSITGISAWDSITTFASGSECYVEATHKIYKCSADSTDEYPPNFSGTWTEVGTLNKGIAVTDTIYWTDLGATNYWAAFDAFSDTRSVGVIGEDGLYHNTFVIDASLCNSVSLFRCKGKYVDFKLRNSSGTIVWTERVELIQRAISDWIAYFYDVNNVTRSDFYRTFNVYSASTLEIDVVGTYQAEVGLTTLGYIKDLGDTQFGIELSILDYSTHETSANGVTSLVQGYWSKTTSFNAYVLDEDIDFLFKFFAELRSTPCVYICGNRTKGFDLESTLIWGWYSQFKVVIPGEDFSYCSITVEGLA